jgi:biotin operon repressor
MMNHTDRLDSRTGSAGVGASVGGPAGKTATVAMLRSFVTLAETLNLSEASKQLGVTRQTLRRHIDDLEALRGVALFRLENTRYTLTAVGQDSLYDAQEVLTWCDSWNSSSSFTIRRRKGFENARFVDPAGRRFFAQQHSLGLLHIDGLPLMRRMLCAWGTSLAQIEHPAMKPLRPYLVLFRRTGSSWVFAEVGEKSAYARWFGLDYAHSAPGALYNDDRAGNDFNRFISRAYAEVHNGGGLRLDHLFADLPRGPDGAHEPASFQRMLAGCVLPDGTQALAMLAVLTNRIDIDAIDSIERPAMPDHLIMDREMSGTV